MDLRFQPSDFEYMEKFLKENPIDPAYDKQAEMFDSKAPPEQLQARFYQRMLEKHATTGQVKTNLHKA